MTQITVTSFLIRATDEWWSSRTPEQKKAYLAKHPRSKYAKQGSGSAPSKPEKAPTKDNPIKQLNTAPDKNSKSVSDLNKQIDHLMDAMRNSHTKKDVDRLANEMNELRNKIRKIEHDQAGDKGPKAKLIEERQNAEDGLQQATRKLAEAMAAVETQKKKVDDLPSGTPEEKRRKKFSEGYTKTLVVFVKEAHKKIDGWEKRIKKLNGQIEKAKS